MTTHNEERFESAMKTSSSSSSMFSTTSPTRARVTRLTTPATTTPNTLRFTTSNTTSTTTFPTTWATTPTATTTMASSYTTTRVPATTMTTSATRATTTTSTSPLLMSEFTNSHEFIPFPAIVTKFQDVDTDGKTDPKPNLLSPFRSIPRFSKPATNYFNQNLVSKKSRIIPNSAAPRLSTFATAQPFFVAATSSRNEKEPTPAADQMHDTTKNETSKRTESFPTIEKKLKLSAEKAKEKMQMLNLFKRARLN